MNPVTRAEGRKDGECERMLSDAVGSNAAGSNAAGSNTVGYCGVESCRVECYVYIESVVCCF